MKYINFHSKEFYTTEGRTVLWRIFNENINDPLQKSMK